MVGVGALEDGILDEEHESEEQDLGAGLLGCIMDLWTGNFEILREAVTKESSMTGRRKDSKVETG